MNDIKLQTGDIVLYKPDSFIGNTIAKITKSDYSHVALVIEPNKLLQSNRFVKSSIKDISMENYDEEIHYVYRLKNITELQKAKIIMNSYDYVGKRYDYLQILWIFLRVVFNLNTSRLNNLNKFICSEIIDRMYQEAGIERKDTEYLYNVTPQELLEKYDFKKIY